MDGRRFTGPKAVTVWVTVGPEFISTAALQLTANARTDVVLNPGEFNFGTVPRGTPATQVINIDYVGSNVWEILDVVNDPSSPVEVKLNRTYRQPPRLRQPGKVGYRLEATLKPTAPDGPFRVQIGLRTNDQSQILSVPAEGTVQATLTASPNAVNGITLKVGQALTRKIFARQPAVPRGGGGRPGRRRDGPVRDDALGRDALPDRAGAAATGRRLAAATGDPHHS